MPKLPLDQTQWAYTIQNHLLQKHKGLEPNIVRVQLLEQTPDGLAFGFVVLTRGVVPFVVREGDLQPMDLLLTMDESGEARFQMLSERNLFALMGGIPLGSPVTERMQDLNSNPAINYAGHPGMMGMRGRNNGAAPGGALYNSVTPVKLASEAIAKTRIENVETILKVASEMGVHAGLVERYKEGLGEAITLYKKASDESRPTLLVLEPKFGLDMKVEKVAAHTDKGAFELTLKQATDLMREVVADGTEKVASLLKGDIIHWSDRGTRTFYRQNQNIDMKVDIEDQGLWEIDKEPAKVWKTTYLDGKPCRYLLAATASGHHFATRLMGTKYEEPLDEPQMRRMYQHSDMKVGDLVFLVNDKSQAATVPFKVRSVLASGDTMDVYVTPMLGIGDVRLTFGNCEQAYTVETGHLMFPNRGWAAYKLNPRSLTCEYHQIPTSDRIKVRLVRGGGVFKVFEAGRPTHAHLTEGELHYLLGDRYGLAGDQVESLVKEVKLIGQVDIEAIAEEEPVNIALSKEASEAIKFACDLLKLDASLDREKLAAASQEFAKSLVKEAAPAPEQSGPNRPEEENPVESGRGAPGMGQQPGMGGTDPSASIPMGMDPPGFAELSDMLIAYALGQVPTEEMSDTYTQISDKLTEVENLLGKVLLLVQLQKVEFITYNEVKRLLDEADKFRATVLNASMLQSVQVPVAAPM